MSEFFFHESDNIPMVFTVPEEDFYKFDTTITFETKKYNGGIYHDRVVSELLDPEHQFHILETYFEEDNMTLPKGCYTRLELAKLMFGMLKVRSIRNHTGHDHVLDLDDLMMSSFVDGICLHGVVVGKNPTILISH